MWKGRSAGIVMRRGRVLVFYRKRGDGRPYFCLPGGGIEDGETPFEAMVRELKEETSLSVVRAYFLGRYQNKGIDEYYYGTRSAKGRVKFGGIEKKRMGPQNYYRLEWHTPVFLLGARNFYPGGAKKALRFWLDFIDSGNSEMLR